MTQTRHSHPPAPSLVTVYSLLLGNVGCWHSWGQTADLASTFRHCCQLGQNIQQKPFGFIFVLTNIFFQEQEKAWWAVKWSKCRHEKMICWDPGQWPLSSVLWTPHRGNTAIVTPHCALESVLRSSPPEYVLLIAIFQENFPHDGRYLIRTSYREHCTTVAHHPVHHCLVTGLQLSRAMCNNVTIWQCVTQSDMWTECRDNLPEPGRCWRRSADTGRGGCGANVLPPSPHHH